MDTNWYLDTGATDHVTGELEKLAVRDRYTGTDQIHTASGQGMDIEHIGYSVLSTPSGSLHLNNILHAPSADQSLLSAYNLMRDNDVFIELHPEFFLVKDQATRRTILQNKSRWGLFPVTGRQSAPQRQVLAAIKPSTSRWHKRLGHPALPVVQKILRDFNLPVSNKKDHLLVCDACQMAKSHQLPYSRSTSESTAPLELIFSDVWGPGPVSVGRQKYYVSFIDDFSKFSWIYLLKNKSDVFEKFRLFQAHVERLFDRKIIAMQTDWGGEYQRLNSFFERIGITHHVSCPHAHQQNGSAERKHRHIIEVGLSLLAHAFMPLKFWDEAFLTAVYLINRIPSRVIKNQTPLVRLFDTKPNYYFLHIFSFGRRSRMGGPAIAPLQ